MPIPTPFHPRTSNLSKSKEWREWSGYWAAATYEHTHEREYFAIRNSAALIDVSPLYKYDIIGPQAAAVVDRMVPRDIRSCEVGQILYTPWCDDDGKVVDDGTLWRVEQNQFRITAADSSLRWIQDCGVGLEAEVTDASASQGALALQGPNARQILLRVAQAEGLARLPYYHLMQGEIGGAPVTITRTGYTGDLGYELWMDAGDALEVWDRVMLAGADYGLLPAGLAALDIARIEAGLLLIEVDYISSLKALTEGRRSSPYELGLGWTVSLDSGDFVGRRALLEESKLRSEWSFVGLDVVWSDLDNLSLKLPTLQLPFTVPPYYSKTSRISIDSFSDSLLHAYPNGVTSIDHRVGYVLADRYRPLRNRVGIGRGRHRFSTVRTSRT